MRIPIAVLASMALASAALAQVGPDGYDWVTVGAAGYHAYAGTDPGGVVTGRGSVARDFRIGRTEVTTAQWLEFFNTFWDRVGEEELHRPIVWGAVRDTSYAGPGMRWKLRTPEAGNLPVGGVDWRTSARLCNWLHNGKSSELSAMMDGAYDVSTFGYTPDGKFTDQEARHPGARYWIPSLDEWLKAAYYDPDKGGSGVGGWWTNPNSSDEPPAYGPPGVGEANTGFSLPNSAERQIPVGSYPGTTSPWGVLDIAGGVSEWTESVQTVNGQRLRFIDGSHYGGSPGLDWIYGAGGDFPTELEGIYGFRIASAVPGPGTPLMFVGLLVTTQQRGRRRL